MPTFVGPLGAMGEEVLDADGEVVVGVEEAGGAGDDAVAVVVGVGGEGYVVFFFVGDHGGHGVGAGAVHADLPSQSQVMKRKVGSTLGLRICNDGRYFSAMRGQ